MLAHTRRKFGLAIYHTKSVIVRNQQVFNALPMLLPLSLNVWLILVIGCGNISLNYLLVTMVSGDIRVKQGFYIYFPGRNWLTYHNQNMQKKYKMITQHDQHKTICKTNNCQRVRGRDYAGSFIWLQRLPWMFHQISLNTQN